MSRRRTRQGDHETLYRQWLMLRAIPREPRKIDPARLEARLADQGIEIDRRSIQRDLHKLSGFFPLVCDQRSKPYGWSFTADAPLMDVPGMDPHTALTFCLAEEFLRRALPRTTLASLEPHFGRAADVLEKAGKERLAAWPTKIRILPQGLTLLPPKVDQDVLDLVYRALLEEKRFRVRYRGRTEKTAKVVEVNPLGLIYRSAVGYLVSTLFGYTDVRQLVLHRMSAAEMLDTPRTVPPGFNLDEYAVGGTFHGASTGRPLKLRLKFLRLAAAHLYETPLSQDQVIVDRGGDWLELRATVPDTMELHWWLKSFGEWVEVLEPRTLRASFAKSAKVLARTYSR